MPNKLNNMTTAAELKKYFSSRLRGSRTLKGLEALFCGIKESIEPKYWNNFKKYHFYYDPKDDEKQNFFAKIKLSQKKLIKYRQKIEEDDYNAVVDAFSEFGILMLCMAWKNGDLKKEMSIVNGILAQHGHSKNEGIDCYGFPIVDPNSQNTVFFQFGLFLQTMSDRNGDDYKSVEPIIDQHSIRAYKYFIKKEQEPQEVKKIEENDVKGYKKWHYKQMHIFKGDENAFLLLNQIMFLLGKKIKP